MMADWLRQPPQSLFLPVVLPIYQHFMQNGFSQTGKGILCMDKSIQWSAVVYFISKHSLYSVLV